MVQLTQMQTEFDLSPTLKANELVNEIRARGQEILHMGCGESPFPVPQRLQKALGENADKKSYVATGGLPALCEAAHSYYCQKLNLDPSKFDAFIAPGSELILYTLQMAVEGDLILPVPSWVSYAPQARMLGDTVISLPTQLSDKGLEIDTSTFQSVIKKARKNGHNPRKIILNYPSNPAGLTIPTDNLNQIAQICRDEDIMIISDEIYAFVHFENDHTSIAEFAPDITVVTTALSKHLSLGGWRLGVSLVPKNIDGLHARLCTIASETWSCVAEPVQHAAIEAFQDHPDIENHIRDCTAIHAFVNREIAKGLQAAGIDVNTPQGGFYHYPCFENQRNSLAAIGINTSPDLAEHLINEYGLVSLPSTAFGDKPESLYLRLSGCDYDGASVLKAYQEGHPLNIDFLKNYAPRIIKEIEVFRTLMSKLG